MNLQPGDVVKSTRNLFPGERRVLSVHGDGGLLLLTGPAPKCADGWTNICPRVARREYVEVVPQVAVVTIRDWSLACRDIPRHPGKRMELARRSVLKPYRAKCVPSEAEIIAAALRKFDPSLERVPGGTAWRNKQRVAVGKWDGARQEMVIQAIDAGQMAILLPGQGGWDDAPPVVDDPIEAKVQASIQESDKVVRHVMAVGYSRRHHTTIDEALARMEARYGDG